MSWRIKELNQSENAQYEKQQHIEQLVNKST